MGIVNKMARSFNGSAGTSYILPKSIGFAAAAGNMYSSMQDMQKLTRWMMDGWSHPEVLDPQLRREWMSSSFLTADGVSLVGTPFEIQTIVVPDHFFYPGTTYQLVGKGGGINGYSAFVGVVPALNLSISCGWTKLLDGGFHAKQIMSRLLPTIRNQLISTWAPSLLAYQGGYEYTQQPCAGFPRRNAATISRRNTGLEFELALPTCLDPPAGPRLVGALQFVNSSLAYVLFSGANNTLLRAQSNCMVRFEVSASNIMQLKFKFSDDGTVSSAIALFDPDSENIPE